MVWATGFRPDFSWIDLDILGDAEYPVHRKGVAEEESGLYFVGLPFQQTLASAIVGGVGADARYVVKCIRRSEESRPPHR